jgi:hypothetical protein
MGVFDKPHGHIIRSETERAMELSFEQALIEVRRRAFWRTQLGTIDTVKQH